MYSIQSPHHSIDLNSNTCQHVIMNILPSETRALLRSTVILTSLPQIVSELCQNALDAGARHVDVGVDFDDWSCWVRDDGSGISAQDLNHIGSSGDAGRYGSSICAITEPLQGGLYTLMRFQALLQS